MTKRLSRVMAVVVVMLAIGCGTASAYTKTYSVIINLDGVPRMVNTESTTVGELLESVDGVADSDYVMEYYTDKTELEDNMIINLTSVTKKVVSKTEAVPFETKTEEDSEMPIGTEEVKQEGVDGIRTIEIEERYEGNELLSSKEISNEITTPAQDKVIVKGTKKPVEKAAAVINQMPKTGGSIAGMDYAYAMNVKATGYTPWDPGCTGITATGTKAKRGVIAVDPAVIPYGTKMYIPGYGYGVAEDTGGAINGSRIDLCYGSTEEAYSWGVRNITIYILE